MSADLVVPMAPDVPKPAAAAFRLLVVDDDLGAIQQLARMLLGFAQVSFATNGEDALAMARTQRPDLILLDAEMPGLSGFQVFKALRVDPLTPAVPVIFATSHRAPEVEAAALRMGAADFISKPLLAEQVPARVCARLHGTSAATPAAARATPQVNGLMLLLLVDSDELVLYFERVALSPLGTVQFARGGADALAQMACEVPYLVLVAANMAGMDGFALCRHMRTDPALHQVPLLLLGDRADWRAEAYAFELGANDFMARPYRRQCCRRACATCCARRIKRAWRRRLRALLGRRWATPAWPTLSALRLTPGRRRRTRPGGADQRRGEPTRWCRYPTRHRPATAGHGGGGAAPAPREGGCHGRRLPSGTSATAPRWGP